MYNEPHYYYPDQEVEPSDHDAKPNSEGTKPTVVMGSVVKMHENYGRSGPYVDEDME